MFTRPVDLADHVVSAVVQDAWRLRTRRMDYAPVGAHCGHEVGRSRLTRIARPSSSGRVNCGQCPVGRST
jgi:hypothetical protein